MADKAYKDKTESCRGRRIMKEKVMDILRGLDIPEFKAMGDMCVSY